MNLSVVIPVYNSAATLEELSARLDQCLSTYASNYEVICVNDGSHDNSWSILVALSKRYSWLTAIDLMRNYGQHNALLAGVLHAQYEIIITLDDDLQHPPEEIPHLLKKLEQGFDVVYGSPIHEPHGIARGLASRLIKIALQSVMGVETARHVSAFRAFRTELRKGFAHYQSPFLSLDVLLSWSTSRFGAVPVKHEERKVGTSNYTFWKLLTHAFNMMTGFSLWPLKVVTITGFIFTLFGMGILAFVLIQYFLHGSSAPGFPFLASVIAIFSGTQLFALGVLGEYLGRIHYRTMERPVYVVRQIH
jgi:glycosyltransferase involved in cell wall biosynthesis